MVLTELNPGFTAVIKDITLVSDLLKQRLIDLGIMEGTPVSVRQRLPFGGPITVEAAGQSIGLRCCDACQIKIEMSK